MAASDARDRFADRLKQLAHLLDGNKPGDRERVSAELKRLATS